jgi:hypothetical protein
MIQPLLAIPGDSISPHIHPSWGLFSEQAARQVASHLDNQFQAKTALLKEDWLPGLYSLALLTTDRLNTRQASQVIKILNRHPVLGWQYNNNGDVFVHPEAAESIRRLWDDRKWDGRHWLA